MIKYITMVAQSNTVTHVLEINGKAAGVSVKQYNSYNQSYQYGKVNVSHQSMYVETDGAHLAEILIAIEMVKVIKEDIAQKELNQKDK